MSKNEFQKTAIISARPKIIQILAPTQPIFALYMGNDGVPETGRFPILWALTDEGDITAVESDVTGWVDDPAGATNFIGLISAAMTEDETEEMIQKYRARQKAGSEAETPENQEGKAKHESNPSQ